MNRRDFLISAILVAVGGRAAVADASITDIVLTEIERRLIRSYYQSHRSEERRVGKECRL